MTICDLHPETEYYVEKGTKIHAIGLCLRYSVQEMLQRTHNECVRLNDTWIYVMETDKNVAATTGHLVVEVDLFINKEENAKAEGSNPAEGMNISTLIKVQLDATVCRHLFTATSLYMFRVSRTHHQEY